MAEQHNLPSVEVTVVNTGTANIGSVVAALERLNAQVTIVTDPDQVRSGHFVVVPGVGSFGAAMGLLQQSKCDAAVRERVAANKATLFICVGLQVLAASSEESPGAVGLRILDSHLTRFHGDSLRVPQHGWNSVHVPANTRFFGQSGFAYYSNSYKIDEQNAPSGWNIAWSNYGGKFVAALEKGNVLACQFHPELSGKWGSDVLRRWLHVPITPDNTIVTTETITQVATSSTDGSAITTTSTTATVVLSEGSTPVHTPVSKTFRVVPCLDVRDGLVVKGIQFQNIKEAGLPDERAKLYEFQGADEIVVLDISATIEARKTRIETVKKIRKVLSIPLTVGGGVTTADDAQQLLLSGADKVAVNTAAVKNPQIISEMAQRFGRQCTVLSIDAVKMLNAENKWEVVISAGKQRTGMDVVDWAKQGEALGAGEILLTSYDRDGTKSGYDLELIFAVSQAVKIPIIASGGGATSDHMVSAIDKGADAVLAASIFHYEEYTVETLKQELRTKNISVRL